MAINLIDYENRARDAIRIFWRERESARQRQTAAGRSDQGERAGVTAGKNMDGFIDLICDLVKANGLDSADIHQRRAVLTLPGFFRPTKLWDLLIVKDGTLIAAIELKSQVGPSFGNNFNNRAEEAIGTSHDFWTAYREGAFGQCRPPFVGWLMLVEDAPGSRSQIRDQSPHFPALPEFKDASYLQRYDLLCRKLVQEKLYTAAALLASPRDGGESGVYTNLSPMTGLKEFVAELAGHIAVSASRQL